MFDWLGSLWDTDGYVPRSACGNWTPEWIAVHTGADVLIWLAYLSIPLVLLAVARHSVVRPLRPLVFLFAAFIVACGTTHLIDSLMFRWPLYRLSGATKLLTAAVSWATVFALVPAARRLVRLMDALPPGPSVADQQPDSVTADPPELVYALAILVAVLAVLVRFALDPVLGDLHAFSVCLLAVTLIAWYGGYGPALVTLLVSGVATLYLFVPPRQTFATEGLGHQFGLGIFLFTGLGVVLLGEIQRNTRRRLNAKVMQLHDMTAALSAEKQKLEAALGQLDALVRNAPYGIAYFDADLKYIRVNDTFAVTHNLKLGGNVDRPLTEILQLPPDMLRDFRRVLDAGEIVKNRLVTGAGLVWEVTAFAVPMADGVCGLGVIGLDVTDRERATDALKQSEARLRELADAMPQIVYELGANGAMEFVNRRWVEYTGQPNAAAADLNQIVPDDDRRLMAEQWAAAFASGTPFEIEFRLKRHADGQERWFLSRTVPIRDASGQVTKWYGTSTDIDDQKRQQQELREAALQLRQLTEGMPLLMWACTPDGECDYLSRQWLDYTGTRMEKQIGRGWLACIHPDDRASTTASWRAAVAGTRDYDTEYRLRRPDGEYRWFAVRGIPLRDESGRITRWFGCSTDIDDRKRRAVELETLVAERTAALRASNEDLEKFAYIASHDLQEPLRKVQAFGTRLAEKFRDAVGEQGKDYIDRMLDSATRMRKLIEDLLAFSRVVNKPLPFAGLVDLNEVVRDVLQVFDLRLQQTGGRIDVEPLPALPGDASQLRQVFQNLIGNALKFARPGVPPEIRITAVSFGELPTDGDSPHGPGWRIAVADNGIGFEQGYAERIFELFQRLHSRSEYDGTGLGLAIVRKIILRHGATITARGQPNEGAAFVIDWPTRTVSPT